MGEEKEVWVCLVRGRAYNNPREHVEYYCFGVANGKPFLKADHRDAGCGIYRKVE